jgi:hypothetical protein
VGVFTESLPSNRYGRHNIVLKVDITHLDYLKINT